MFRKASPEHWPKLLRLLLSGEPVRAAKAVGWLVDYAGTMEEVLRAAWSTASGASGGLRPRKLETGPLKNVPTEVGDLPAPGSAATQTARRAIAECVRASCGAPLAEALAIQATHSARFMLTRECREGRVGAEQARAMQV
jgi:enoyl-CoA hydratase/carnithine racemase